MPKLIACILFVCMTVQNLHAQLSSGSNHDSSLVSSVETFYKSLGDEAKIYNGRDYREYSFALGEENPYFEPGSFLDGDILFDGMVYHNIPMLYDLVSGQLIIRDFYNLHKIALPFERIQQFILWGHKFTRILHTESNKLKSGFYDELYNHKIALFVRREKEISDHYTPQGLDKQVLSHNSYYILKDGVYYPFKNKNGLLDILRDKKKEIQQFFKTNHIKYKENPERAMIFAAEHFDQLTN